MPRPEPVSEERGPVRGRRAAEGRAHSRGLSSGACATARPERGVDPVSSSRRSETVPPEGSPRSRCFRMERASGTGSRRGMRDPCPKASSLSQGAGSAGPACPGGPRGLGRPAASGPAPHVCPGVQLCSRPRGRRAGKPGPAGPRAFPSRGFRGRSPNPSPPPPRPTAPTNETRGHARLCSCPASPRGRAGICALWKDFRSKT